jgi:hypothetical protein
MRIAFFIGCAAALSTLFTGRYDGLFLAGVITMAITVTMIIASELTDNEER